METPQKTNLNNDNNNDVDENENNTKVDETSEPVPKRKQFDIGAKYKNSTQPNRLHTILAFNPAKQRSMEMTQNSIIISGFNCKGNVYAINTRTNKQTACIMNFLNKA